MAREQNFGVNVSLPYDPDELNTNPIAKLIRGVGEAYAAQKAGVPTKHELKREQELIRREQVVESAANQGRIRGEGRGDVGVPFPVTAQARVATSAPVEKTWAGKSAGVPEGKWWEKQNLPNEPSEPQAPARKSLQERFATPIDALNSLSDEKFKQYVDEARPPGIGYVSGKDGRIERIMPQGPSPQGSGEKVSAIGLQALADYKRAMSDERRAATDEAGLGIEGRRADLEGERIGIEKQKLERELKSTDTKNPLNVMKALLQYSPKTKRGIFEDVDGMMEKVGEEEIPDIAQGIKIAKALGVEIDDSVVQTLGGGTQPKAKPALPKVGDVVKGYKFKGGNPADPKSWEKT